MLIKLISFLSNIPSFLYLILGSLILFFILRLVFRKQRMLLWTILGSALAIGLLFFFLQQSLKRKKFQPLASTSMFKKMEYIEHLRLVSFYSEEVIVLGTKEKVQKIVDNLREEYREQEQQVSIEETQLQNFQQQLDALFVEEVSENQELILIQDSLQRQQKEYKEFKKCKHKSICEIDTSAAEPILISLYADYQKASQEYEDKAQEFADSPWEDRKRYPRRTNRVRKRKELKAELQDLEQKLILKHESVVFRLERALEIKEKIVDDQRDLASAGKKNLKKNKNDLINQRDKAQKSWNKSLAKLQKTENRLKEAELELAYAIQSGEEIAPEVLIVIPVEVSVYIDMKEIQVEGDVATDSILVVRLPELQFDSVLIQLPEENSAVYDLDQDQAELVASRQGAYFDFFEQLKQEIIELESTSKEKAIENGILEQGRNMAENYLRSFVSPLGYEIQFEPAAIDTLRAGVPVPD